MVAMNSLARKGQACGEAEAQMKKKGARTCGGRRERGSGSDEKAREKKRAWGARVVQRSAAGASERCERAAVRDRVRSRR